MEKRDFEWSMQGRHLLKKARNTPGGPCDYFLLLVLQRKNSDTHREQQMAKSLRWECTEYRAARRQVTDTFC